MANSANSEGPEHSNEDGPTNSVHVAFKTIPLTRYTHEEWVGTKLKLSEVSQLHAEVVALVDELQQLRIKTEDQFKSWRRCVGDAEVGRTHPTSAAIDV